jgi:large subunit ribosomal protein L25
MEVVRLAVQQRSQRGKGVARRLRRAGMLPAVLYGHGGSEAIAIAYKDMVSIRQSGAGENALLELAFEGDQSKTVNAIFREIQIDPVSQAFLHVDMYRVRMDEAVKVTVPLEFVNEPEDRLKAAQSMLTPLLRDVEVECLPRDIPEVITVDLEALEIGDVLRAEGLVLPPGVTLITEAEEPIITTETMRKEVVEEAAEEEAVAATEGGAVSAAEKETREEE